MNSLRIVYAGTPDFAAVALDALIEAGHSPVAVYTQPDRPAGRGRKPQASPVKQRALRDNIPVYQPESLKTPENIAELAAIKPDLMIVAAYGLILPQAVLDIPTQGCINIHASLLPRWRGAAPIQRAIAAGDKETGITIMQMDAGLDTGDMLLQKPCPISPDDTGGSLHDKLAKLGGEAIVETLQHLDHLYAHRQPQDDTLATYAHKLSRQESWLDWNQPARTLHNRIRAFNPWPGTQGTLSGQTLKFWQSQPVDCNEAAASTQPPGTLLAADPEGILVQCGSGQLRLLQLQLPGKKPQKAGDLINGHRALFAPGNRFAPIETDS